jgi:hypothetical protein
LIYVARIRGSRFISIIRYPQLALWAIDINARYAGFQAAAARRKNIDTPP